MKTVQIKMVAVEFPVNTTRVSVDLIETTGIITRTTDSLTLHIPGIYQALNSELYNLVLTELRNGGFDVMTTQTADETTSTDTTPVV